MFVTLSGTGFGQKWGSFTWRKEYKKVVSAGMKILWVYESQETEIFDLGQCHFMHCQWDDDEIHHIMILQICHCVQSL